MEDAVHVEVQVVELRERRLRDPLVYQRIALAEPAIEPTNSHLVCTQKKERDQAEQESTTKTNQRKGETESRPSLFPSQPEEREMQDRVEWIEPGDRGRRGNS